MAGTKKFSSRPAQLDSAQLKGKVKTAHPLLWRQSCILR